MTTYDAWDLLTGPGQGVLQVGELVAAFGLSALVGLERELRGKSAGLRTQTIVGVSAALMMLVSKYGFGDVLGGDVVLDPSRVAAQIVSGVGFLGAGLIITRQGAVRGLTTAAAVWETAGIGMAAGAGLVLLAVVVVVLHFAVVLGLPPLLARLPGRIPGSQRLHVMYVDGHGVLRQVLTECGRQHWTVTGLAADPPGVSDITESINAVDPSEPDQVGVVLTLSGSGVRDAARVLGVLDGVTTITVQDEEAE
ncbi:putative magnesium transport MgtC family protein [Marmoricola endophyticus]|uniref:Magnesium transport MgtC family protein n=1 Tax=Marmoricola endophyticus TaxID=2040280 RepID=A0A917BM65_9ACTN|nr:MgtC/SapB family protein [Marmoricola endophyticus]GGF47921.1 putative magnesium transport MgtC family protein [Marmoricola endophyticus]